MKNESSTDTERERRGVPEADGMLAAIEATDVGENGAVEPTGPYLKGLIEAVLFVSDHPLELKDVARAARIDRARALELLEELTRDYEGRGIRLELIAGGYAFRSSPDYAERVRQYLALRPVRLSRAQLETLAIVAYRQPITRPEIDDVRGVDSGPVLKGLLERDMIRIIGKKDEPGRPMLYGTTGGFLEAFSLKSLRDLPTLREYTELSEESRRVFEAELGEPAPEGPLGDTPVEPVAAAEAVAVGSESTAPSSGPGEGDDDDEDDDEDDEDDEDDDDED
jgi:segregation and condensation protein B